MPDPNDGDTLSATADERGAAAGAVEPGTSAEVEAVVAFWKELELPGLVDVHAHFMPPSVPDKVWDFLSADRILLGTDFPSLPYPYLNQLLALARLDLGPAWLRAVCHDNAARAAWAVS